MKIAHLTTVDMSLRFLLLPQLKGAQRAGHEVIGISGPGPWVADLEAQGVRHVPLESSTRAANVVADAGAVAELWAVLRRERPDVLHTHNPKPGVYGRLVGRMAGVPIVVNTVHGLYALPTDPPLKRVVVYGLEALAARCSDAELVQNPEDLDLMRRLRLTRPDARLLGNGVDVTRFAPWRLTAAERMERRAEIGATEAHLVVGTVGRLVKEKGYRELFQAAARLDRDRYRVLVIGATDPEKGDSLRDDELRAAEQLGIRFLGHREDVETWYAAMDVFVLASHREGFPRAAMEAAASGLPVVATDIRGCRQVVIEGENGLLVPPGDPVALADAVKWLGEHADQRHAMATAARRRAEAEFDERRVVEMVLDTYEQVAVRKGFAGR